MDLVRHIRSVEHQLWKLNSVLEGGVNDQACQLLDVCIEGACLSLCVRLLVRYLTRSADQTSAETADIVIYQAAIYLSSLALSFC